MTLTKDFTYDSAWAAAQASEKPLPAMEEAAGKKMKDGEHACLPGPIDGGQPNEG
jgi:hypothetical protein